MNQWLDPEYLEDFRALKVEAEQYLQDLSYLLDSYLALSYLKPISVGNEKIYKEWNSRHDCFRF